MFYTRSAAAATYSYSQFTTNRARRKRKLHYFDLLLTYGEAVQHVDVSVTFVLAQTPLASTRRGSAVQRAARQIHARSPVRSRSMPVEQGRFTLSGLYSKSSSNEIVPHVQH